MEEYEVKYITRFICEGKNLETIKDIKSLGSSITSMEMCMIIEDRLNELNMSILDKNIKKISYNFNRGELITLIIKYTSLKKLNKEYRDSLKDIFLKTMNNHFLKNRIHVFKNKEVYLEMLK